MKPSLYVLMETKTGTEKLAEALLLRGFPVEVKQDFITLRNGSTHDYAQLKSFLETLNIPVFWNGGQFQLLTNRFPLQMMKKIIEFRGREHRIHMEGYHFKWRSFVNRRYGIRTNTTDLCPYTAIMVKALNEAGIVTLSGCNGHSHHSPNFKLSGIYHGIWFSLIQQQYMKDLSLHYQWKVEYTRGATQSAILANKPSDERWEMKKVLADCFQMANVLFTHAGEIRDWKAQSFKRSMKQFVEPLRESGDVAGVYDWMRGVAGVGKR
ncbi:hypothetical protein [Bacillus tuaregi]|uniref:hypothetical protein n=1 Tax=Bacillus tuaregi TaxID=1816695 RepID=UPI0009FE61B2|nr:hypothetical protein [Bacillus tuaregi]